jgi:hypothetical protein
MADGSGTVDVVIPGPLQMPPVSTVSCHRILSTFPDESTHPPSEKSSASLVKPITTSSIWPVEQAIEGKGSDVDANEKIPKFEAVGASGWRSGHREDGASRDRYQ